MKKYPFYTVVSKCENFDPQLDEWSVISTFNFDLDLMGLKCEEMLFIMFWGKITIK